MSIRLACLAALAACTAAAHAAPLQIDPLLTQDEVKARKVRIEEQYDQSQAGCRRIEGRARELCNEQARGERDIQQAQLDMDVEPTADHDEKVRLAKAGAALSIAMVRCKDFGGQARTVCRDDAKANYAQAKQDAKLQKEVVAQQLRSENTVRQRSVQAEKIAEAEFNAARQRCAMLPDEGRDNCLADAKKRFGRF